MVMSVLFLFTGLSPEEGAETIIYLATSPEVEKVSGKYFVRSKAARSSSISNDPQIAEKLWQLSLKMTTLEIP